VGYPPFDVWVDPDVYKLLIEEFRNFTEDLSEALLNLKPLNNTFFDFYEYL
jgi:hypothetical protein